MASGTPRQHGWRLAVKRAVDVAVSSVGLVLLSPLFLIVGLLIQLSIGRPIFFLQQRPGKHARPFMLVKFRTMRDQTDVAGNRLSDADRLTALGRLLRSMSIDELPQLWNVLKGDISLVGPRPLLMQYLERYTPEQMRRHEVFPGITGWAQINGRNALTWSEKFRLDVWYVDHWSLLFDFRILCKTAWQVLRGKGISQEGHATMPEYKVSDTCDVEPTG